MIHNLRSSCWTGLAERCPIHVVCAWLGNSRAVAQEHELQVTDAHFTKAVQNPVQYTSVKGGIDKNSQEAQKRQSPAVPGFTDVFNCLPIDRLTPTGFEPVLPA